MQEGEECVGEVQMRRIKNVSSTYICPRDCIDLRIIELKPFAVRVVSNVCDIVSSMQRSPFEKFQYRRATQKLGMHSGITDERAREEGE